jgi:hypothetical protein
MPVFRRVAHHRHLRKPLWLAEEAVGVSSGRSRVRCAPWKLMGLWLRASSRSASVANRS